jgi:hypothetical protein
LLLLSPLLLVRLLLPLLLLLLRESSTSTCFPSEKKGPSGSAQPSCTAMKARYM